MAATWGYAKINGPSTWEKEFPAAKGKSQSPIDIKRSAALPDSGLKAIVVDYNNVEVGEIANTGSSWKAQVTGGSSSLTGGPLGSKYALEQFHAHWGGCDKVGSEHTMDGQMYSAELHLVHWDTEKFKNFGEAAGVKGGLAVLGMFLKVGKHHPELEKITKLLPYIAYKGQNINVLEKFNCANFLPSNKSYFTYDGSLTTPPCYESVNWIVLDQPIEISAQQLQAFRSMKSFTKGSSCPCDELKGCMIDNYRPCCEVNDRRVRVFREQNEE